MEVNSVEERHVDGNWIISIVEGGITSEQVFHVEIFAKSWAEGQKRRLGLGPDVLSSPDIAISPI